MLKRIDIAFFGVIIAILGVMVAATIGCFCTTIPNYREYQVLVFFGSVCFSLICIGIDSIK